LLCVTRLDKDKNIDILFAVVKKIAQQKNINIIIIGNGEKYDLFKTEFENNKQVKIYSHIQPNSSDLNLFYNYSNVLLMPSMIEAQSLVTMEAMACGLPIVAYNGGALPELVKENQNGILVHNNTSDDFIAAINKIFSNKDLHNQYIEASRKLIQVHDINSSYEQIYHIYQSLLTK
jgi:glycosyltransferase involved in cell wall biosynthesis